MPKRVIPPRPVVRDGLIILGQLVKESRLGRRWTRNELAQRAGISVATIANIENGASSTAVGTVFDVADLVGVPIFGIDDRVELARLRRRGEDRLELLPARVRHGRQEELSDDF